jgi:hypothetical protein
MSEGLHVYARERVDRAALVDLFASGDVAVDEVASGEDLLVAVRGARRRYSFGVGLAAVIELEDA